MQEDWEKKVWVSGAVSVEDSEMPGARFLSFGVSLVGM